MRRRHLRPVVVVQGGAVAMARPGVGLPVVLDLDEHPADRFAVKADDRDLGATEDLAEALELAERALPARRVELELLGEAGSVLAVRVLYGRGK